MGWEGYEFLASGSGQRLERWQGVAVLRPESGAHWPLSTDVALPEAEGVYSGEHATGGTWSWKRPFPEPCIARWGSLSFLIRPTASKHLGLFPEQAPNWHWIMAAITAALTRQETPRVLNLFGYTGGATLAAAAAGAAVTHVDAARAMVSWCSENARLSGLGTAPVRYIVEDALTFLNREIRRGSRYDAVIMDPPAFGRGKGGEVWKLSVQLPELVGRAADVLSGSPLFLLLNTYGAPAERWPREKTNPGTILQSSLGGNIEALVPELKGLLDQRSLPCGLSYRWTP